MNKQKLRADIPFAEALHRIHVNSFGSNAIMRLARSCIEIDIWGINVPLPGAKKTMEENRKANPGLFCKLEKGEAHLDELDLVLLKSKNVEKQKRYRKRQRERDLRLVINQNFDPKLAQMLTVTFAEAMPFEQSERHFGRLLQELQRKYQNMKYVAVIEPHKSAGYHMHTVVNQPLARNVFDAHAYMRAGIIKSKRASLPYLWPNGIYHLKPLNGGGNLGGCLAPYFSKRLDCSDLWHKPYWRGSQTLEWYEILRGEEILGLIEKYRLGWELRECYSYACFDLEHIQSVRHYEFDLSASLGPAEARAAPVATKCA